VAKVFLKHPQSVTRIIELYGVLTVAVSNSLSGLPSVFVGLAWWESQPGCSMRLNKSPANEFRLDRTGKVFPLKRVKGENDGCS
jgi:hypothetical protein